MSKRETFSSKFAFIAAAAGSAVGLGNIWKFPYESGKNGGAAFILLYLGFVVLIGLPLIIAEIGIGRMARRNVVGSFVKLSGQKRWGNIGIVGVLGGFAILSFYGVVAGWTLEYLGLALHNSFNGYTPSQLESQFHNFIASPAKPALLQLLFTFLTGFIVYFGVKKGIERYSKILMPCLFLCILVLDVWSLSLPKAGEALSFLFAPDFSKITTQTVLFAMGQAFFSLSVGIGTLLTYGTYLDKRDNLLSSAVQISAVDTLVAILAGLAIFPAVFSFGINPDEGAGLVFIALPNIFAQMTGGYLFGVLFFALLCIAALTSSISILELLVVFVSEQFKLRRTTSTILVSATVGFVGVFSSLSMGEFSDIKWFEKNLFNLLEFSSSNIFLPLGGLLMAVFLGWKYSPAAFYAHLTNQGAFPFPYYRFFRVLLKFVIPVAILMVFLNGLDLV